MPQFTVAILREKDLATISRVGGVSTAQMVMQKCGAKSILNGFTTIPPRAAIPLHYHNCEESVVIVQGNATVEVDGKQFIAGVSDVTWLPANMPHRFINSSESGGLRIFWTYASGTATRTLIDSGETGPIWVE